MPKFSCRVCGRKIIVFQSPREDDDLICLRCEERRDDARMDDHFDDVREERRDDES